MYSSGEKCPAVWSKHSTRHTPERLNQRKGRPPRLPRGINFTIFDLCPRSRALSGSWLQRVSEGKPPYIPMQVPKCQSFEGIGTGQSLLQVKFEHLLRSMRDPSPDTWGNTLRPCSCVGRPKDPQEGRFDLGSTLLGTAQTHRLGTYRTGEATERKHTQNKRTGLDTKKHQGWNSVI